jgi:hypothetical protein
VAKVASHCDSDRLVVLDSRCLGPTRIDLRVNMEYNHFKAFCCDRKYIPYIYMYYTVAVRRSCSELTAFQIPVHVLTLSVGYDTILSYWAV